MTGPPAAGSGIVEGFYGRPWTHEARLSMVRWLGDRGLGLYVWAPKSDPSHRTRWSEALGSAELREIEELAGEGRARGVSVVHGISPLGLTPRAVWPSRRPLEPRALSALERRVRDVVAAGVERFALLFDDTLPTALPALASRKLGVAHGLAARHLLHRLGPARGAARVLLVPAVYHRRIQEMKAGARRYLEGVASVVGADVPIAWTGPSVFSSWIAGADVKAYARETGLAPWIWNNAAANDWLPLLTGEALGKACVQRLTPGPVANVSAAAARAAAGVVLNGAREPVLTRIPAATLAELLRDPDGYAPSEAWRRAIEAEFGARADLALELLELCRSHPLASPHVAEGEAVVELLRAAERRVPHASVSLERELERLASLEPRLREGLAGHAALAEMAPTAAEVSRGAAALLDERGRGRRAKALLAARPRWASGLDRALTLVRTRRFGY